MMTLKRESTVILVQAKRDTGIQIFCDNEKSLLFFNLEIFDDLI